MSTREDEVLELRPLDESTLGPTQQQAGSEQIADAQPIVPEEVDVGQPGFFGRMWNGFQTLRRNIREDIPKFTQEERDEIALRSLSINRRLFGNEGFGQFSFGEDRAPSGYTREVAAGRVDSYKDYRQQQDEPLTPEQAIEANSDTSFLRNIITMGPAQASALAAASSAAQVMTSGKEKEDPWGTVMWDSLTRVPALVKRQYGGAKMFLNAPRNLSYILDSAAAQGVPPEESFALEAEAFVRGKDPGTYYQELLEEAQNNPDFQAGQEAFREATDFLEHYTPRTGKSPLKYYSAAILEGAVHMAPALIASAVTRSPTAGAALMGGQVFADQYAESIESGRTHSEAVTDGVIFGAAETLTERIPLGILTREGGRLLKRTLKSAGAEGIQEPITELIQSGYDMAVINDEMTLGEAMVAMFREPELRQRLIDAGIIGAGVGGSLGMVTHPFFRDVTEEDINKQKPKIRRPQPKLPSEVRGEISPEAAEAMGIKPVDVTLDLLERVGEGEPLTLDEEYTLTEGGLGRFVGSAGNERVVLNDQGLRERGRLQNQGVQQRPESDLEQRDKQRLRKDLEAAKRDAEQAHEAFQEYADSVEDVDIDSPASRRHEVARSRRELIEAELTLRAIQNQEGADIDTARRKLEQRKAELRERIAAELKDLRMPAFSKETAIPVASYPDDAALKAHTDYRAAKGGDGEAAIRLVGDLASPETLQAAQERFSGATFVPVIAEEEAGHNAIPAALASYYAEVAGGEVESGVTQVSRAFHTGAGPLERVMSRPRFAGPVQQGQRYVLVDDVSVMGGTIAELASHIRANGGEVAGVVTLTNASRRGTLRPQSKHVRLVEERFGDEIRKLGIEPEALTADEAQYLAGFRDVDALRGSLAKTARTRRDRLSAKGVQPSAAEESRLDQITEVRPLDTVESVEPDTSVVEIFKPGTREPRLSVRDRIRRAVRRADLEPTPAQIEAGNYRKGHLRIQGIPVTIENPRGSIRRGVDRFGQRWAVRLKDNYGYIKGVQGKDKDHLDVFVGMYPEFDSVVVINQKRDPNVALTEENFDEHKVMLGYRTPEEAVKAYQRNYDDGGALIGSAVPMTMESFKEWIKQGNTRKIASEPLILTEAQQRGIERARERAKEAGVAWKDVQIIETPEQYRETRSRYGLPNSISETEDGLPFGATGSMFVDDDTGKPVAYAPSGVQQRVTNVVKTEPAIIEKERTNAGKGVKVEQVRNWTRSFYRAFRTAPVVRVVEAVEDLPKPVQQQLWNVDADTRDVTGVYTQEALSDTIYLIANNISNKAEAIETLAHEIVGHYGLHQIVPPDIFNEVMDKVARSFPKEVAEIARIQGLNLADQDQRRVAAEEYIAYTAQQMIRKKTVPQKIREWIRDLVQAIRRRIQSAFGEEVTYTEGQIWAMIAQASDYVQNPGGHQRDQRRGLRRHMGNPTYYSQMFKVINDDSAKATSPAEWLNKINGHVKAGRIKEEEVKWSGIREYLGDITYADLFSFAQQHDQLDVVPQQVREVWDAYVTAVDERTAAMREYLGFETEAEREANQRRAEETRVAVNAAEEEWRKYRDETPKKLPKEAVLGFIQANGVDIQIVSPGGDVSFEEFDSDAQPDDIEELRDQDEFYEDYDEFKQRNDFDEYVARELREVHVEHGWFEDIENEPIRKEWIDEILDDFETWEEAREHVKSLDAEELNELAGWDGTSEDAMHMEAQERAEQAFDEDHYQDFKEEWEKKNQRRRWSVVPHYDVTTDSDGDFVVYNYEGEYEVGWGSTDSRVNELIENDLEEHSGGRWGEYVVGGKEAGEEYTELLFKWTNPNQTLFTAEGHWGRNENMVAHVRFDTRKDKNGKDAILIDEIQSDWHQALRDRGVLDPELAERLAEAMEEQHQTYMDELAPELMEEMAAWDVTRERASGALPQDVDIQQVRQLLNDFIDRAGRMERYLEGQRGTYARDYVHELYRKHNFEPRWTDEQNREAGWDGTTQEEMRQEARRRTEEIITEENLDDKVREVYRSLTWSDWLVEVIGQQDIIDQQAGKGRTGEARMRMALLYRGLAQWAYGPEGGGGYYVTPSDPTPAQREKMQERRERAGDLMLRYGENRNRYVPARSGLQPAPFEKTWQLLVIKGMLNEAVRRGHDRIFMTPGEVHGMRWAGAEKVEVVEWDVIGATTDEETRVHAVRIKAFRDVETRGYTDPTRELEATPKKLHTIVGADVAQRIERAIKAGETSGRVSAKDVERDFISVGTRDTMTGAREIYNVITPNIVNKWLKKYGARMTLTGRVYSLFGTGVSDEIRDDAVKVGRDAAPDMSSYADYTVRRLGEPEKQDYVAWGRRHEEWFGVYTPDGNILSSQISTNQEYGYRWIDEQKHKEVAEWFETWEIEITPELKAAAQDGFALFHRRKGKRRTGDPGLDKALEWADTNIGPQKSRTMEQFERRLNEVIGIENKIAKSEQALVDQFAGIKWALRNTYGEELSAEMSGYKQAHFTTSGDAQMYAFMTHGVPEWRDGVTRIRKGSKGYLEILEPITKNLQEYFYWKAALRAKRLMAEGRERFFDEETIEELLKLGGDPETGMVGQFPEFQDVLKEEAEWKSAFLDWAQGAGVINADTRPLWEHADHVPFYRLKSDEMGGSFSKRAGMGVAGIANQRNPIKRLKGGKEPLGDLFENQIINFTHLASTVMKNKAMQQTVENLEGTGLLTTVKGHEFMEMKTIAESDLKRKLKAAGVDPDTMTPEALESMRRMWTIGAPQGDDIVSVLVNGKRKYYHVHEETLLRSLTAINEVKFNSLMGRLGMWLPRKAKRVLTTMVTLDPAFMGANWFRDVFMAFANSRHAKFPRLEQGVVGAYKALAHSEEMINMMAAGGAFYSGYINAMDPGATTKALRRAMRKKGVSVNHRVLDAPWKLFHLYNDLGAAMENANRIGQAYIPAIKAGASVAEAVWEAKDLMNFAKHGDHAIVQFLIQTVPFLNARIQGLVRYGQRFREAPGVTFTKSFLYAAAVVAIWLSNKDDERYKELAEEEKDLYIHFWLNGNHYRLPKAFEVGMLFGTMPERAFEYFYSNESDAGKLAIDRMKFILDEVFMVMDPTTIVPLPQVIKPLVEASTNYSFFFQGPIVPEYMQDIAAVKPDIVYRPSTSPLMRELAKRAPRFLPHTMRNPMQLEYLMRGYFGTLGTYAMMMSDDLVRKQFEYPPRPALRWSQIPFAGRFYRGDEPPSYTKYERIIYDVRNNARQIDRAINQMQNMEMADEVDVFLAAPSEYNRAFTNEDVLASGAAMESVYQALRRFRQEINVIWTDEEMPGEQKLRELNRIYRDKNEIARAGYEARPGTEPAETARALPVGSLALFRALNGMTPDEAAQFMRQNGLGETAGLIESLPRNASNRLAGVIESDR